MDSYAKRKGDVILFSLILSLYFAPEKREKRKLSCIEGTKTGFSVQNIW